MSLLLRKPCVGKPALVRYSLHLSNGFSSSMSQTPPCFIVGARSRGNLVVMNVNESDGVTKLDKRVPLSLIKEDGTIGASHGWVATLKGNGVLRLQDDFNPVASNSNPKRIPLPPLVTLPHCQTKMVTNVSMSSSSPEDEDCVVAVKFLGPQISFCRPGQTNSTWTNIRIESPCFYSSPVMFSKKDEMFRIPGSGGHVIASWDLCTQNPNPKIQRLRFENLPKLTEAKHELMDSYYRSEHLVESRSTGETFLVKWYKKIAKIIKGRPRMKTQALMVFKLDEEGYAVYTQDIGDLCIFVSKAEPFCVPATSFPGMSRNYVQICDVDSLALVDLADFFISTHVFESGLTTPYFIPPQNIDYGPHN